MNIQLPERSPAPDHQIEKAIVFLINRMQESGHNPKPVIFHSLRVGIYLFNYNYEPEIVMAGILHDVVEDSDTRLLEIEKRFGGVVAELVQANTADPRIGNRAARGNECIQRCLTQGKKALVVMAADMLDNTHYLDPALDENFAKFWVREKRYFVNTSKSILANEPVWQELSRQCAKLEAALVL